MVKPEQRTIVLSHELVALQRSVVHAALAVHDSLWLSGGARGGDHHTNPVFIGKILGGPSALRHNLRC